MHYIQVSQVLIEFFENSTIEMNGKENYIAELKVARAFYYYLLLEAFGNVPIIDRFDVPDGYLPATEPRSKVFEFVESELKNNINNLSEVLINGTQKCFWHVYI